MFLAPINCNPEYAKTLTLSAMILHNLLIDAIGKDAVANRYGIVPDFSNEVGYEPGISGNVPNEAKRARDIVMKYYANRDGVR
ncbi:hypothetical protein Y032_0131g1638 [Ancylostoma ceylanicum]|uniref:Uncharacterized protein n=1 Tax=Ancylostoma ceylanicum TaxID=53326 RepID=A0A016T716_9BILA|nr:hypothetical protein Y032_0131g1638 [Ancylostoma ceylanicum]